MHGCSMELAAGLPLEAGSVEEVPRFPELSAQGMRRTDRPSHLLEQGAAVVEAGRVVPSAQELLLVQAIRVVVLYNGMDHTHHRDCKRAPSGVEAEGEEAPWAHL